MPNLGSELLSAIEARSSETVINESGRPISGAELASRIAQLSDVFTHSKVQRLGLFMGNSADWIAADIACLISGVVVIPVPHFFSDEQKNHILKDAEIQWLFSSANSSDPWLSGLPNISRTKVLKASEIHQLKTSSVFASVNMPRGTSKITYTSGSTGAPKGVCLSADLLHDTTTSLHGVLADFPIERHLSVMPYSTLLENLAGIYVALLSAATIFTQSNERLGLLPSLNIDGQRFAQTFNELQPNSLIVSPQLLELICELKSLSLLNSTDLKFVAVGGASCAVSLLESASSMGLPVYQGYGLSECGSVVSLSSMQSNVLGKVGKVLPHLRVDIGASGELIVKGNNLGRYLKSTGGFPRQIATGDIGNLDEQGVLSIAGRSKNLMVLASGRNVSPEWVESELLQQPQIKQCVVYGDGLDSLQALIVASHQEIDWAKVDQAVERANSSLPKFAQVSQWEFVDTFTADKKQVTSTGKLIRSQILVDYVYSKKIRDNASSAL